MDNHTVLSFNSISNVAAFAGQNVLATGASTIFLVSIVFLFSALRKPIARVPGPWYTTWTSIPLYYNWIKGRRMKYIDSLHKKYGPIVRICPGEVSVCDIPAAKTVYSIKETFVKTKWYKDFTVPRDTMFNTSDTGYHRKSRRMLAAGMADSSIHKLSPRVGGHVDFAIDRMKAENATRKAVDIYKWWLFMATDIIVEFTYGESFHMLERGERNEYSFFLENSGKFGIYRGISPLVTKLATLLPLRTFQNMTKAVTAMESAAADGIAIHQKITDAAAAAAAAAGQDTQRTTTTTTTTFFTSLFRAQKDGSLLSRAALLGEGQTYIIAGSDTTASTLTFLVWSVCRRPALKAALLAEMRALPAGYTDADLRALGLLGRVIKEALRLYAAAPESLPRRVPRGGAELCGHALDEGTVVGAQAYSMHRVAEVFERPLEFDPGRWVSPSKEMMDSYMPFGRGSRVCIGLHLAYTELRMGTVRFFRTFPNARVSTREGMSDLDMDESSYFIMSPKGHRCLIEVE